MRRPRKARPVNAEMRADIDRIETIWHESLARSGGPFLFGGFTAADAMFAPVVNRFDAYVLTDHPDSLKYMAEMQAHPAWRAWAEDAAKETWIVSEDEA